MTRRIGSRWIRPAAGAVAVALLAAACQFSATSSLPLPGGAGEGPNTYTVTAYFTNVLDLVPASAVRVNDVVVGRVASISLTKDYTAKVVCRVDDKVHLPANTIATEQQTSLLGDEFVALGPPPGQAPVGTLAHGAVLPVTETSTQPGVEQVFGALSLLLNGGGINQLQTISVELAQTLSGRELKIRSLLTQLNTFVGSLNVHRAAIVGVLDQLNRLSAILVASKGVIATAIDQITPGLRVLANSEAAFTNLLTSLSRLGAISTRVIDASETNTVTDLHEIEPVLGALAQAGQDVPQALQLLLTYPFPDNFTKSLFGDYLGLEVTVMLSAQKAGLPVSVPATTAPGGQRSSAAPTTSAPGSASSGTGSSGLPVPSVPVPTLPTPTPSPGLLGILSGGLL